MPNWWLKISTGTTMPSARSFNRVGPNRPPQENIGSFLRQNSLPVPLNPLNGNSKHENAARIQYGTLLHQFDEDPRQLAARRSAAASNFLKQFSFARVL